MGKFEMLCGMLPAEVNWGDPITPQMVEEIALAARAAQGKRIWAWMNSEGFVSSAPGGGYDVPLYAL